MADDLDLALRIRADVAQAAKALRNVDRSLGEMGAAETCRRSRFALLRRPSRGGVPEWPNGAVSKTVVRSAYRGFESHPLRHGPQRR